jgi:membrane protease YdiL (CAAX protease family)
MRTVSAPVRRHPLVAFFVLAYALTWPVIPLVSVSLLWGFPALFGPALAAVIVAAITDGKPGLKSLLGRTVRWRVGLRWYAIALALPVILTLATAGVHLLLDAPTSFRFGTISVLAPIIFVLVVGEELGWRGYALPKLLARVSPVAASLILGVLWGVWHLPTFFVPGAPQYGLPIPAFVILTMAYSILFTWVYLHARGSVLIATLLHGAINLSQGLLLGGLDPARQYWLLAAVYTVAALVLLVAVGPGLSRKPRAAARRGGDIRAADVWSKEDKGSSTESG